MTIKNVIFDLGGVLLEFNPYKIASNYLQNDEDIRSVIECVFLSDIWAKLDQGQATEEDVIVYAKKHLPTRMHGAIEDLFRNWFRHFSEINGATAFINNLLINGYNIFLLSNINDKFYVIKEQFEVLKLFDNYVISSDIQINKPNKGIYRHLLDKYKLNPAESLFLDDREENVLAARNMGIHSEVFINYNDAKIEKYFI